MKELKENLVYSFYYFMSFAKWVLIAALTGIIGGLIGTMFYLSVKYATDFRMTHFNIIWFLPISGIVIVFMYSIAGVSQNLGTNHVIKSVRGDDKVPFVMAPLIFFSTVITHLFGGSAGREGAALQLGGSIGTIVGKITHLGDKDMNVIVLCGMSSVFSALFGTPLTATFFALEVISIGIIHYSALIPCLTASLVAYEISILFGIKPTAFHLNYIPSINPKVIIQVAILAVLCGILSIAFCVVLKKSHEYYSKFFKNYYLRIIVGGTLVLILTLLVGNTDYNGAGVNIISSAMNGIVKPEAFLLKIIFTALTIGAGFKGGEIVPTFFIGSTFGCFIASVIGLNPAFGAALGLVAMFCGVVNCPIASLLLAFELFGGGGLTLFAIAVALSYVLSGYYGLYSGQKIVYSKLSAEYININTK